jgi:hypothetical protein
MVAAVSLSTCSQCVCVVFYGTLCVQVMGHRCCSGEGLRSRCNLAATGCRGPCAHLCGLLAPWLVWQALLVMVPATGCSTYSVLLTSQQGYLGTGQAHTEHPALHGQSPFKVTSAGDGVTVGRLTRHCVSPTAVMGCGKLAVC